MSCPVFAGNGTLLAEDTCVWAKATGDQENDSGDITNSVRDGEHDL